MGGVNHGRGGARIGEVSSEVLHLPPGCSKLFEQRLGSAGIRPPWLLGIVRRPGVEHHPGAVSHKPAGDGGPDGDPTTGPGHEHDSTIKCTQATAHPEDLHMSRPGRRRPSHTMRDRIPEQPGQRSAYGDRYGVLPRVPSCP